MGVGSNGAVHLIITMLKCMYFFVKHFYGVSLQGVAVHCLWGLGRTGTMLACYLVKYEGLTASQAISKVRQLRPYSIETEGQEEAVHEYYQSLQG